MAQPSIQPAFASGEWAPKLRSRVDIQKYHVGASLMRNFYVDWAGGGASTRSGTKLVSPTAYPIGSRLIPFQPSANVSYVLLFGTNGFLYFFSNGSPILFASTTISGITNANPAVVTDTAHGYTTGQVLQITGVVGMTQVNNRYFSIPVTGVNTYTLSDP